MTTYNLDGGLIVEGGERATYRIGDLLINTYPDPGLRKTSRRLGAVILETFMDVNKNTVLQIPGFDVEKLYCVETANGPFYHSAGTDMWSKALQFSSDGTTFYSCGADSFGTHTPGILTGVGQFFVKPDGYARIYFCGKPEGLYVRVFGGSELPADNHGSISWQLFNVVEEVEYIPVTVERLPRPELESVNICGALYTARSKG